MRLSSQVFFIGIPTADLFAPLVPHQLIIALLIGSHLFLFSIIFIFFLPFFLRKTKTSLPLAPGERGMCRDYQSVIFLLFLSFFFSRFCLLSRPLPNPSGSPDRLSTFHWKSPRSRQLRTKLKVTRRRRPRLGVGARGRAYERLCYLSIPSANSSLHTQFQFQFPFQWPFSHVWRRFQGCLGCMRAALQLGTQCSDVISCACSTCLNSFACSEEGSPVGTIYGFCFN